MQNTAGSTTVKHQYASWIELSRDHLLANLETIRARSGTPDVLAVIKANAYGHGLREIAQILEGRVKFFGVATLKEGLSLKEHFPKTSVFLFGHLLPHEIPVAVGSNITMSVSSFAQARAISDCAESLERKASVHLKIDTGMGRMGFRADEAVREIMKIRLLQGLLLDGIYMHFPTAEVEDLFRTKQIQKFQSLLEELDRNGIAFRFRHAQNSAASLTLKNPFLNIVRPGLALYGIHPDPSLRDTVKLAPVLELKSRITFIKRIESGETAGYGRTFTASSTTNLAILPLGYSHGYPWSAWKNAQVLHRGNRYPLAGKISMDYLTVNLGRQEAAEGDIVTLIGKDQDERISAEDVAQWAGSIPYEIVTQLNANLPRVVA